MNTLLWLTSGILAQAGTPVIPPDPPAVVSAGGGQRRRFVVQGKRGYVIISDPRLIAFFKRVLDGEELTEIEVTKELLEIAPDYKVKLEDNIQVLSDILDKLEALQEAEEDEVKEHEYQEQLKALETQVLLDEAREVEAQRVKEEALEDRRAELEEARLNRELAEGLDVWAAGLCRSAMEEANIRTARSMVKTERVRKLKLRIDQWRKTLA
jgi:hypothetical protein